MTTLAKVQTETATASEAVVDAPSDLAVIDGGVSSSLSATIVMPPGFQMPGPSRPMVYIGGEEEGGSPFYVWNKEERRRDYTPTNRFEANLLEVRTAVYNEDDPIKRAVKLILEFVTASGERVGLQAGAKTWAALGLCSALSKLTADELNEPIGVSGKVGASGKVTFINVFSDKKLVRNPDAEELLKESRKAGNQEEVIIAMAKDINEKLAD